MEVEYRLLPRFIGSRFLSQNSGLRKAKAIHALALILLCVAAPVLSGCVSGGAPSQLSAEGVEAPNPESAVQSNDLQLVSDLPSPEQSGLISQAIAPNDLLEISVFQVADLNRTTRVDSAGFISLPLIGRVKAQGNTSTDLEGVIAAKYAANYLQNPEVSVFVKESFAQRVTMDGQFTKPGVYPVSSQSTLLEVVAAAGGLTNVADEASVFIYRQFGERKLVAKYSIAAIRSSKASNPRVYGGDIVVSFTSGGKVAMQNLREALGIAASASTLVGL